jgi:hypothetical protein
MTRTLTMRLISAEDPDQLDAMSYDERRESGGGATKLQLLHDGEPDVLVRVGLDIDQGVYGAAERWDADASAMEQTSAIFLTELEHAAEILKPFLADPIATAERLVEHAESGEDPARVARALTEALEGPARGPAEEAATWIRVFMKNVPDADRLAMGIAWELRTPKPASETTSLPEKIGDFAEEMSEALGGEIAFEIASNPTCAIRIGGHCSVTVSKYGAYYRVALPLVHPWVVRTREEGRALVPTIQAALAARRPVLTMTDVVASLPREWNLGLQGDPIAQEALLWNARGDVNLEQKEESVIITIHQGTDQRTRELRTFDDLAGLHPWILANVEAQARTRANAGIAIAARIEAERAAMRVPSLEEVLAVLRTGHEIQVGGGRSFPTYAMKNGQLVVIHTSDGYGEEVACSEDRLREAIAEAPNVFDAAVRHVLSTN